MKVGMLIEVDLSVIDSKVLLEELKGRNEDRDEVIIEVWKSGESPGVIKNKFGDYGMFVIENYKHKELSSRGIVEKVAAEPMKCRICDTYRHLKKYGSSN